MNIFYWNITSNLSPEKINWIENTLKHLSPDLLCIAEGSKSEDDCKKIDSICLKENYVCYCNPIINRKYLDGGYKGMGLKIYYKSTVRNSIKTKITLQNLKRQGRIVYMRIRHVGKYYSIFFIHGISKVATDREKQTKKRGEFMTDLHKLLQVKTSNKDNEKIIILGDFNAEPWERFLLCDDDAILSFFTKKSFEFHKKIRKPNLNGIYWNPIMNCIEADPNNMLIATYYNKPSNLYSILDLALFSKQIRQSEYNLTIVSSINKTSLIKRSNSFYELEDGFDHLPLNLELLK